MQNTVTFSKHTKMQKKTYSENAMDLDQGINALNLD